MSFTNRRELRPFTLVELLTVLVIIMVLAGLLVGGAGMARRKSIDAKCRSEIHILEVALEQYRQEFGYFPLSGSSWIALTDYFIKGNDVSGVRYHGLEKPSGSVQPGKYFLTPEAFAYEESGSAPHDCLDPYAHSSPLPARRPYYYQSPGRMNPQSFDLWSAGYDGRFGGGDSLNPEDAQNSGAATQNCDDITNWKRN